MITENEINLRFEVLLKENWVEEFYDSGKGDWQNLWFLDGEKAVIEHSDKGMDFYAGDTFLDDSCHAVLWTKASFEGDIKIEFNYTRLDHEDRCVNILYLQATGMGEGPYDKDISKWNNLRKVPAMSHYYDRMYTYHISYAAFNHDEVTHPGYIRARRYMASGLDGTSLTPDYESEDFFESGVQHKMTIIKVEDELYLHIDNGYKCKLCYWSNTEFPLIKEGRIGLRHMFMRAARYNSFRISVMNK